jgi:hypothetical protein
MILKSLAGNGYDGSFMAMACLLLLSIFYVPNKILFLYCRYSGFYKGVQSAGAAVAWQVDTHNVSFMSQLIVNWCLTTVAYPLLVVLVMLAVKDEAEAEERTTEEATPTLAKPANT